MKITFEFDTDKEDFNDWQTLEIYKKAEDLASAVNSILEQVKSWYKWDNRSAIPQEEIQDKIYQIINDEGINLEKMGY